MSVLSQTKLRVALYQGAGSQEIPDRFELMRDLLKAGSNVSFISEQNLEKLGKLGKQGQLMPQGHESLLVLGIFEDLQFAPSSPEASVQIKDIRDMDTAEVVDYVASQRQQQGLEQPGQWKPWFPVIDYKRCTHCMQCLSFCLFDVYGVNTKGEIEVRNQDNCKTDCPACSRVCPEVAILFPKYKFGPINGAEIKDQDVQREAMKVDISALLGGDIYKALRERSAKAKSRFSKERDEGKALKERQRCMIKLKKQLNIPDEVLSSLPTLDEIQEKAKIAQARAKEALERNAQAKSDKSAE